MVLFQGEGNDLAALIINGGNGDDFVTIDASVDGNTFALTVNGNDGTDSVDGSASTFPLRLNGGAGNDSLVDGAGGEFFDGGADADSAMGGGGADTLFGSTHFPVATTETRSSAAVAATVRLAARLKTR
jgi:Ca2+-binding RTX toxin-like protein